LKEFREDFLLIGPKEGGYTLKELNLDDMSRLFWGVLEYGRSRGYEHPPGALQRLREFLPAPRLKGKAAIGEVIGPRGIVHDEFMAYAEAAQEAGLPEGKQLLLLTRVTFHVQSGERVAETLVSLPAEFGERERQKEYRVFSWFDWHVKPRLDNVERARDEIVGHVFVKGDNVVVQGPTAVRSSHFADWLEVHFPGEWQLTDASWELGNV
jgi:hypothetical protein